MTTELQDPRIVEYDVRTDEMLVNMGPQHPSTHGVLRLLLRTDGEIVHEVTPHVGYLHRCAEKIGENLATPQWVPYTDRMDYLAGMNMNLGFSLAVEKLVGMELPEKAQVLRVVIAHRDPGVVNWLDPCGHEAGTLILRFILAEGELPLPTSRVVPLADLEGELPAGTPRVTPEEREEILRRRRNALWLRYRR